MSVEQPSLAVLVVEDEAESATLLTEMLIEAGHRVIGPAASADTAAMLVAQMGPDIALVDVGLQGDTDGVELARRLKANWGVPSVFATGRVEHWTERAEGAPIVLRKPYGEADVLDALRRGLEV